MTNSRQLIIWVIFGISLLFFNFTFAQVLTEGPYFSLEKTFIDLGEEKTSGKYNISAHPSVNWQVSSPAIDQGILTLSKTTGQGSAEISFSVDKSKLEAGWHDFQVNYNWQGPENVIGSDFLFIRVFVGKPHPLPTPPKEEVPKETPTQAVPAEEINQTSPKPIEEPKLPQEQPEEEKTFPVEEKTSVEFPTSIVPPKLFSYEESIYDETGRELSKSEKLVMSCKEILKQVDLVTKETWQEKIKDSKTGEEIELGLPINFVRDTCYFSLYHPLIALTFLDQIRAKAEKVGQETFREKIRSSTESFVLWLEGFFKGIIRMVQDLLRNPEIRGKSLLAARDGCHCVILSLSGTVDLQKEGEKWRPARKWDVFGRGSRFATGFESEVTILCKDDKGIYRKFHISSLSMLVVSEACDDPVGVKALYEIPSGEIDIDVKKGVIKADFKVKTPNIGAVKG